jgi:hypothetical protein
MKHNNFEKHIKTSFQEREIKPSPMAWDRLDAMLSVAEQPKKKRVFKIWHFAAALLLLVSVAFVGSWLNADSSVEIVPNQGVVIEAPEVQKPIVPSETIALEEIEDEKNVDENPVLKPKQSKKQSLINTNKTNLNLDKNNALVVESNPTNSISEPVVLTPKAARLLAEIENNQNSNIEITANNSIQISSVKVDSEKLLNISEKEVNQSFRNKVIRNVNKVSTALVNRNLE